MYNRTLDNLLACSVMGGIQILTSQTYIGSMSVNSDVKGVARWAIISEGRALDTAGVERMTIVKAHDKSRYRHNRPK